MRRAVSFLTLLFALVLTTALSAAQGSAGGYGQGGGQGGFGGAVPASPPMDISEPPPPPRPEDGPGWTTRSAVLTPGDRVEYKFDVKAGETLLATAASEAFDPALAVVDATGKELARNDDREEGDQSPFLIYRFPTAGTYTLRVLSFRSAAGGKFTARFRTLTALDVPVGKITLDIPARDPQSEDLQDRIVLRLPAKAGETYDVHVRALSDRGQSTAFSFQGLLGPTGVIANDLETIATPVSRPIFRANRDGDVYVELDIYDARRLEVEVRPVRTTTVGGTGEAALDLAPDEVRLVEFPVKRGGIVRTSVSGDRFSYRLVAPEGSGRENVRIDAGYGRTPMWTYFLPNVGDENDVVRVYRADGTARAAILSQSEAVGRVTLRNTEGLPEWTDGTTTPTLAIGESKLYLWRARKAELTRVRAESKTFQARLDLFDLDGNVLNTLLDRNRKVAADDLYFPNQGTYVVRLTCDGFGGSGAVTLSKGAIPSTPYTLGKVTRVALSGQNYGLYEMNLEAGKRYALTISDPSRTTRVDLLDEEGRFLTSPVVTFERVAVYYFVPERTGRHRLWLRGDGERTFRFERFEAPTLGGG